MSDRIVLYGATGYTGRLVAEALVARGERPVLAGRDEAKLRALDADLGGGLDTARADASRPQTVRALVSAGDVLIATVGPFARLGLPAAEAAIAAGCAYLDSTGEPAFIRRVFEELGPRAEASGAALVTAFGYDWVPGNLAGALALREAGPAAVRVDVGYFLTGDTRGFASGGTRASSVDVALRPSFAWRGGIRTERTGARARDFEVAGRRRSALSAGASEHFALPRLHPQLREVNAYIGWFGPLTRPMVAASAAVSALMRIPGAAAGAERLARRVARGSTGGPDARVRARSGSHVVAIAYDAAGAALAEVRLAGVNAYDFTARILAWGAAEARRRGGLEGTGALGPVEAFGLEALEAGCAEAGIARAS